MTVIAHPYDVNRGFFIDEAGIYASSYVRVMASALAAVVDFSGGTAIAPPTTPYMITNMEGISSFFITQSSFGY